MAAAFELKKARNGQFHFTLKAGNGEIILSSEMYQARKSAETGIASVQNNCAQDKRDAREQSANGKFYFTR